MGAISTFRETTEEKAEPLRQLTPEIDLSIRRNRSWQTKPPTAAYMAMRQKSLTVPI